MTDTTNHAEVIRECLSDGTVPICDALAALDALTREAEANKKDSITLNNLGHALGRCYCTDQGCYTVEPEILMERARELSAIERREWDWEEYQATIAAQAERIKALEAFITDLDCECTPPIRLVDGEMTEKWTCPRCAALAPKEAQ